MCVCVCVSVGVSVGAGVGVSVGWWVDGWVGGCFIVFRILSFRLKSFGQRKFLYQASV